MTSVGMTPADSPPWPSSPGRFRRFLRSRRLPLALAGLAALLTLPSLRVGWLADDHLQRLRLVGSPKLPQIEVGPSKFFVFADGNPQHATALMDVGLWPWWTYRPIHAAFWRPLTVLTHQLDYWLWPLHPALMHAQSVAWFALLVATVAVFYRRMLGVTWVAGLAALLNAIDDARGMPVGFLANRNALIASVFGVATIIAHDRWRRMAYLRTSGGACASSPGNLWQSLWDRLSSRSGSVPVLKRPAGKPVPQNGALPSWSAGVACSSSPEASASMSNAGHAVLAVLAFAAALLAGEFGIGALAYLITYAWVLDSGSRWRRALTLAPYVVVIVIWRIGWHLAGAGIDGIGFYADPLTDPVRFLGQALRNAPILLLGQWALPPSDAGVLTAEYGGQGVLTAVAVCAVIGLALLLRRLVRADRTARFWAFGMLLALVPVCATFPADRLLGFVGLGAFGLIAQLLARPRAGWGQRAVTIALVAVHGVIAPVSLVLRAAMPAGPPSLQETWLIRPITDPALEHQTVVVVTAPVVMAAAYLPITQALDGLPVPQHTRFLAQYQAPVEVRRTDDRTLVVRPAHGFLKSMWDRLARNECYPMSLGERVELAGMTAEVLALTPDHRPAEVAFHFDRPLEAPTFRWLAWDPHGFAPFTPPPIGQRVFIGAN
jgi:hypothetical protein